MQYSLKIEDLQQHTETLPKPKMGPEAPEPSLTDIFSTARDAVFASGQGMSEVYNARDVYQRQVDRAKTATGVELNNPMSFYNGYGTALPNDVLQRYNDDYKQYQADGGQLNYTEYRPMFLQKDFTRQLKELADKHPEQAGMIMPDGDFGAQAAALRVNQTWAAQQTWERSDKGLAAWTASLAGQLYGGIMDPYNLAAAIATPNIMGAKGVYGLLSAAAKTGAVNAATQAVVEPIIQSANARAGLPAGLSEAAESIAGAFLLGAAIDLPIRAGYRGAQSWRGLSPIEQNGVIVGWEKPGNVSREASATVKPVDIPAELIARARPDTASGRAALAEIERIMDGNGQLPETLVQRAEAGDPAAVRKVAEVTGEIEKPAVRGMVDALDAEAATIRVKPDEIDLETHTRTLQDTFAHASDPRLNPAPAAIRSAAPANGWLDALEARIEGVERAVYTPDQLEAAETLRIMREGSPVEVATMMRDQPAMVTQDLDYSSSRMVQARALASLEPELFARVEDGRVSPPIAALVADYVVPEMQARAMDDLMAANPKTLPDARAAVAELLASPEYKGARTPDVLDKINGRQIDDPTGKEAQAQADMLERNLAAELDGKAAPDPTPEQLMREALQRADAIRQAVIETAGQRPADVTVRTFTSLDSLPPQMAAAIQAADAARIQQAAVAFATARSTSERLAARLAFDDVTATAGKTADAFYDNGVVWLATFATNPKGRLAHEGVHHLVETGRLTDAELTELATYSRSNGVFGRLREADYAAAYKDRERLGNLLDQEAAAHLIEDVVNGRHTIAEPRVNGIVGRIIEILRSIREALIGKGAIAADADPDAGVRQIVEAIINGDIAKREATRAVLQTQDITALASRGDPFDGLADSVPDYRNPDTGERLNQDQVMAVLDQWRSLNAPKDKAPQSLVPYLMELGRLQDEGGELTNMLGGATRFLINNANGRALDDAALRAWEAGFIPTAERPTVSEFLDVLSRELSGDKVFRSQDAEAVANRSAAESARQELERMGIADAKTEREVLERLAARDGPSSAVAEMSDAATRQEMKAVLDGGGVYRHPQGVVLHQLAALRQMADRMPRTVTAWAVTHVAPEGDASARAYLMGRDGSTREIVLDRESVVNSRGFYTNGTLILNHASPIDDVALQRVVWHEVTHGLRDAVRRVLSNPQELAGGRINPKIVEVWSRLDAHATDLQVLDAPFGMIMRLLGDADAAIIPENLTLRNVYEHIYRDRTEVKRAELLSEEAVAFMAELDLVGAFKPEAMAAVRADLDDVYGLRGGPLFAFAGEKAKADADTGRSMRRDLDTLGYYSTALEAAKALKQAKGTPEQMLSQLKAGGAKQNEIEATNLAQFLDGKKSVTRDEIVGHLEANRVKVKERVTKRSKDEAEITAIANERIKEWENKELEKANFKHSRFVDKYDIERVADKWQEFAKKNGLVLDDNIDNAYEALAKAGMKFSTGSIPIWEHTDKFTFGEINGKVAVYNPNTGFEVLGSRVDDYIAMLENEARSIVKSDVIGADPHDIRREIRREVEQERDGQDPTKWSSYSLDPSNPTYRETVLHLPRHGEKLDARRMEIEAIGRDATPAQRQEWADIMNRLRPDNRDIEGKQPFAGLPDFESGHFPEPNIIGHMMTSMTKHEGKPVYTIDQIQSDWGQKLRDGGVRDEAKIASLRQQLKNMTYPDAYRKGQNFQELARINAELDTALRMATGNPLVNTTDQWTNTTLRRAIRQAAEADADYIAIPHGDTVLSYNPGDEGGMAGFYGTRASEGIVPKNLRKLLKKIDKDSAKPVKVTELETPSGTRGYRDDTGNTFDKDQTGFTLFPLTDKVKASVRDEGMPLFSFAERPVAPGRDMVAEARQERTFWENVKALAFSDEKRVEKAKQAGFDVDRVLFHGTAERRVSLQARSFAGSDSPPVVWLAEDRAIGEFYAQDRAGAQNRKYKFDNHHILTDYTQSGHVHAVVIRPGKQLTVDADGQGPFTIGRAYFRRELDEQASAVLSAVRKSAKDGPYEAYVADMTSSPEFGIEAIERWRARANYFGENVANYTDEKEVIDFVQSYWSLPETARTAMDEIINHENMLTTTLFKWAKENGYDSIKMTSVRDSFGYRAVSRYTQIVVFDPKNIRSVNAAFDPAKADSPNLMFSLTERRKELKIGAAQRKAELDAELAEIEARFQASGGDPRAKLHAKRAALLTATRTEERLDEALSYRNLQGAADPARAFMLQHQAFGSVTDVPFGDLYARRKDITERAITMMGEYAWGFRKRALLGDASRRFMKTDIENVTKEMAGESTGDATAKQMAQGVIKTFEWLRQRFNAAGGDIPKLDGWFAPQHHDADALMAVGKQKWIETLMQPGMLDRERMKDWSTGQIMDDDRLRSLLSESYDTILSGGVDKIDPSTAFMGKAAAYKKGMEHRVLHFKDADAWIKYQREMGGGDLYAAMIGHVEMMARDIAAMETFGANPNMGRERLKVHLKQIAAGSRLYGSVVEEAKRTFADIIKRAGDGMIVERYDAFKADLTDGLGRVIKLADEINALRGKLPGSYRAYGESVAGARLTALTDEFRTGQASVLAALRNATNGTDPTTNALTKRAVQLMDDLRIEAELGDLKLRATDDIGSYVDRLIHRADEVWASYTGASSMPVDRKFAQRMAATRNYISAATLIAAPISALSDQAMGLNARWLNGLPVKQQLWSFIKGFTPADKELAMHLGFGLEAATSAMNERASAINQLNTQYWSGYIADRSHTYSFLGPMTTASKVGFALDWSRWFASDLLGKTYDELPEFTKRMFQRHGITIGDWRELSRVTPGVIEGRKYLSREDVIRDAGEDLAQRYMTMFYREASFATLEGNARSRTILIGDTKPGTVYGELLRASAMLKSFPTTYVMQVLARQYSDIARGRLDQAAVGLVAVTIVGTLLGATAIQLKNGIYGRDFQDMTKDEKGKPNVKFWMQAYMQGGGAGILGDLLGSATSRTGGGLAGTALGPLFDYAGKVGHLAASPFNVTLGREEKTNPGREAVELARRLTPGMFVPWYVRNAYERMILDELQRQVDPEAYKAFQSKRAANRKLRNTDYFYGPGDRQARTPNLNRMFGAN